MALSGRLGEYRLDRRLGAGAFASVWLAHDDLLEAQVAIKVLADNWSQDPAVRARFLDEARLLRRLDHQHVVRIFAVGVLDDEQPYFAMEWADGGTLEERLSTAGGTLSAPDAVDIARQILAGLSALHAIGVVHRDVKPSNVLFRSVPAHPDAYRGSEKVLLADLGLAKDLTQGSGFTVTAGTPTYMAPEQGSPMGVVGTATDLYAVAAILCEMLTGRPGPRTSPSVDWVARVEAGRRNAPEVPGDVWDIVERGLATDPASRFSDAEAMRRALDGEVFERHRAPRESPDPAASRSNLPNSPSRFVGRDDDLAAVDALLRPGGVLTLVGPGGVGKTRLAVEAARAQLDRWPDGVWLVELQAVGDPESVAGTVLERLGIAEQAGRPALDTLVDVLAGQRRLVILDNCEQVLDGCARLADALGARCPDVALLVTTRELLRVDGERVHVVPPLSLPPDAVADVHDLADSGAAALFLDRASAQSPGFTLDDHEAPLAAAICRRVDGLPLAIELATARLRSLSVRQLHDRLVESFDLLTGGSRTAQPRQQTLRDLIEWSYRLLDVPERALFRRLSVFVGGCDLDAAEAVGAFGDLGPGDIVDLVGSLVDKSLVRAVRAGGGVRYLLLQTLQAYAADQLATTGPDAVPDEYDRAVAAHIDHYLGLARRASTHLHAPTAAEWIPVLEADEPNLRAALARLVERGDHPSGWSRRSGRCCASGAGDRSSRRTRRCSTGWCARPVTDWTRRSGPGHWWPPRSS